MSNNKDKNLNNTKQEFNNPLDKKGKLGNHKLLICLGVIFLIVGLVFIYFGVNSEEPKIKVEKPINEEAVYEYLEQYSNYNDVIKPMAFNDFWPNEYLEINLESKEISYFKDSNLITKVEYDKKKKKNNNIITFKDEKDNFSTFPEIENIESLVFKSYKDIINKEKIDKDEKKLSLIYNALVGNKSAYIVFGKDKRRNEWKYFTLRDFPTYVLNINDLVGQHIDSINNNATSSLYAQINKHVICISSIDAVSYNYRDNMIYCGNKEVSAKKEKERKELQIDFLEKESVAGWLLVKRHEQESADDSDEKITNLAGKLRALDYYKSYNNNYVYISDSTYNKLSDFKWNEIVEEDKDLSSILIWIGVFFIIIGSIMIGCGIFTNKRNEVNNEDHQEGRLSLVRRLFKKKQGEEVNDSTHELKEEKITDVETPYNVDKRAIIEEYKSSKEYQQVLEKSKESAINAFKEGREYKNLEIRSNNWLTLIGKTNDKDVILFLQKIKEKHPNFPRIYTVNDIYSQDLNNDDKQIKEILSNLDKIKGNGGELSKYYKNLNTRIEKINKLEEDYNALNKKYSTIKSVVEEFTQRKEYGIIKGEKELKIWERLAIMLWSIELSNEILNGFGEKSIISESLNKTINQHHEDVMQTFVTRLFISYINDSSKKADAFKIDSNKLVEEKQKNLMEQYNISVKDFSDAYRNFIANLDSHYTKVKEENDYFKILKEKLADKFIDNHDKIKDKGEYLSLLIAMGYHISDYIEYKNRTNSTIDFYPNVKYILSNMDLSVFDNTEFRHNDPAYSGNYTNRVYEWLREVGVEHLQALVEDKLIIP